MSTSPARRGFHRSEEGAGSIYRGLSRLRLSGLADGRLVQGEARDRWQAADHVPAYLGQPERRQLLQRGREQLLVRAGLGNALAPVRGVLGGRLPEESAQLVGRGLLPAGKV